MTPTNSPGLDGPAANGDSSAGTTTGDTPSTPSVGNSVRPSEDLAAERARLQRERRVELIAEAEAAGYVGAPARPGFPTLERVNEWNRQWRALRVKERAAEVARAAIAGARAGVERVVLVEHMADESMNQLEEDIAALRTLCEERDDINDCSGHCVERSWMLRIQNVLVDAETASRIAAESVDSWQKLRAAEREIASLKEENARLRGERTLNAARDAVVEAEPGAFFRGVAIGMRADGSLVTTGPCEQPACGRPFEEHGKVPYPCPPPSSDDTL